MHLVKKKTLMKRKEQDIDIRRNDSEEESQGLPAPVVPSFRVEFSKPGD
jgi:hypothetical protein